MLESEGHEVLLARDASDAMAVLGAATSPVDLALIDINLPGIDGRHLAAQINALSPPTSILYLSGAGLDDLAEAGVYADGWLLRKPFTKDELLERVTARLA